MENTTLQSSLRLCGRDNAEALFSIVGSRSYFDCPREIIEAVDGAERSTTNCT